MERSIRKGHAFRQLAGASDAGRAVFARVWIRIKGLGSRGHLWSMSVGRRINELPLVEGALLARTCVDKARGRGSMPKLKPLFLGPPAGGCYNWKGRDFYSCPLFFSLQPSRALASSRNSRHYTRICVLAISSFRFVERRRHSKHRTIPA